MTDTRLRDVPPALGLAGLLAGVWLAGHELIHLAINVAATGEVATRGDLGPFGLEGFAVYTYYAADGVGAWNDLLTPVLVSVCGLLAVHYADRISFRPLRWAVAGVGIAAWAHDALYSMGVITIPVFVDGAVEHGGDGADALAAFGPAAMLPGTVLLAVGFWVVMQRVQFERG